MPDGVKDHDLRGVQDRLKELTSRLGDVEDGQARAGDGMAEVTAAVRDVADGLRRQDRLLNLNSFAAYLLFTVLLCAVFFFLYRGRAEAVDAERDEAVAGRDAAEGRA